MFYYQKKKMLAFLERGEYNVILVDWSPLTAMPWYSHINYLLVVNITILI